MAYIKHIAAIACAAAAMLALPAAASASTAANSAVSGRSAAAASQLPAQTYAPCGLTSFPYNGDFWRCTSTSATGAWVSVLCSPYTENNAGTVFNVYGAANQCDVRVWLHQYINWANNGWSYCIDPLAVVYPPAAYQHPENIYISDNTSNC